MDVEQRQTYLKMLMIDDGPLPDSVEAIHESMEIMARNAGRARSMLMNVAIMAGFRFRQTASGPVRYHVDDQNPVVVTAPEAVTNVTDGDEAGVTAVDASLQGHDEPKSDNGKAVDSSINWKDMVGKEVGVRRKGCKTAMLLRIMDDGATIRLKSGMEREGIPLEKLYRLG